jgi:hypothetical protein
MRQLLPRTWELRVRVGRWDVERPRTLCRSIVTDTESGPGRPADRRAHCGRPHRHPRRRSRLALPTGLAGGGRGPARWRGDRLDTAHDLQAEFRTHLYRWHASNGDEVQDPVMEVERRVLVLPEALSGTRLALSAYCVGGFSTTSACHPIIPESDTGTPSPRTPAGGALWDRFQTGQPASADASAMSAALEAVGGLSEGPFSEGHDPGRVNRVDQNVAAAMGMETAIVRLVAPPSVPLDRPPSREGAPARCRPSPAWPRLRPRHLFHGPSCCNRW